MMHWTDLYRENVRRYDQRPGQAMFNAWAEYKKSTVDLLAGTEVDCFHDDSMLGDFIAACLRNELRGAIRDL